MSMLVVIFTLIAATWVGMAIVLFKTNFLDDKNEFDQQKKGDE